MFKDVDSQQSLPKLEEEILKFWDENKIFEKSIEQRKNSPEYSFYDGPPFATGTPHYGHIVASTMKDVVPRYFTMKGYKVPRKWGWDCHGLPIENIAEKELGITHKKEIEEMGVAKFNEICRSKVLTYVKDWEKVIRRLGRWADMENAYKTMDLSYMESVWWVFKTLWDKDLVYESYRSMHICPRCETTLSQSEVAEGYKTIKDLSVVAKFELLTEVDENHDTILKEQDNYPIYILSWTTTPWTLIGNVALAVGKDIDYVKIKSLEKDEIYILAKERLGEIKEKYAIIDTFKGEKIVGFHYQPLFNYYFNKPNIKNHENGWKIYAANFVTTGEGTGIVHIAPAFGEDDMKLGKEKNLPFIQHIGMDGVIKSEAKDFAGMSVKPIDDVQKTDVVIIKYLADKNLLFSKTQYEHSYPHCWRCDTPLLNYATNSWFVKVENLKEEALKLAKNINWQPLHIKKGRFGKWLEGARDWSISRQRYWASCIPLWRCECGEIKAIGSIKELEGLSGEKITDLHKDKIDHIVFACPKCQKNMHRIPDVLDTWFDSGSMPYAEIHYPFEQKDKFKKTFPAEFIGEGVDQTRAWFYYLHILSTAITNKNAYKNVIVNGIVLAEDGKKMSKRLNNYPDPMEEFDKFGADAMRYYLLTSPVMQAENLNFTEKDLAEISRRTFRMLWNSYGFFVLYSNLNKIQITDLRVEKNSENILDKWIISELNILLKKVNAHMEKYELVQAARLFSSFIDDLSNWYLRRSRNRFKESDKKSFITLHYVLVELVKAMAPFTPFVTEEIYKNLTGEESVHLADYPVASEEKISEKLSQEMEDLRNLVEKGLAARNVLKIRVRQPLSAAKIQNDLSSELQEILKDEINVKEIVIDKDLKNEIELDTQLTPVLQEEGLKNDFVRLLQDLRKENKLNPQDVPTIFYQTDDQNLKNMIEKYSSEIKKFTNLQDLLSDKTDPMISKNIAGTTIQLGIKK